MANQAIALGIRAPQPIDIGGAASRYANMMGQMANMDKLRLERETAAGIRNITSDPNFNPSDAASLNKLIGLGPAGNDAAQKVMQAQKLRGDMTTMNQDQAIKRVGTVGAGLVGMLRDPSDATLAQTIGTFKAVGMDPAEYQGVMAQLSQIPDANQRKIFLMNFINQSEAGRTALKFVLPDIKFETVGDAHIAIDNNPASPTVGQEIFRITASPEPIKMTQNVVDSTLYNTNPVTGVSQEATLGDATANLVPQQRTTTRTDTGVVSPYAVGGGVSTPAPSMGNAPAMTPNAGGGIPGPRVGGGRGAAGAGNPADVVFGFGQYGLPSAPLSSLPMGDVQTFQRDVLIPRTRGKVGAGADKGTGAVGAYQITYGTLKDYGPRVFGANWKSVPFTAANQDKLGAAIWEDVKNGNIHNTWAGMPNNRPGVYSNTSWDQIKDTIIQKETGGRSNAAATPGRPTGGVGAGTPQTIAEAQREKAFKLVMPIIGYNPKTGDDAVTRLISGSTSGGAQMLGSDVAGYFGVATEGRKALAQLRAIADNMTFEKLRGKLGAQISDADVRLIEKTMGDIANGNTPAETRLAVWQNVVYPILQRGANMPSKAAIDDLRKNPSRRNEFDGKFGKGKAAIILGR